MTTVRSFNKELQALIDFGHDCCARIDDHIHECCQRIREAHENEVAALDIALRLKEEQDAMDTKRCGDTSAGGDGHAADRCGAGGADDQLAEEVAPITQELRDGAERYCNFKNDNIVKFNEEDFDCLCDAIDAIHAQLEHDVEMWRDRAEDMRMERDDALKEHHAWAPESHYVMLPKDADGEPVHIGNVMDSKVDYLFDGKPFTVRGLVLCEDGWEVTDGRFGNRYKPDSLRHHHTDSWERIIEDALTIPFHGKADVAQFVARCKALAGDADE